MYSSLRSIRQVLSFLCLFSAPKSVPVIVIHCLWSCHSYYTSLPQVTFLYADIVCRDFILALN